MGLKQTLEIDQTDKLELRKVVTRQIQIFYQKSERAQRVIY